MDALIQPDLFMVTAFDPPVRDNRDVMEFPFLSLQKRRTKPIEFTNSARNIVLKVTGPEDTGIATIWDWDLIVFATSHINEAIERGLTPNPRLMFHPYDALRYMGKSTGGKDYKELVRTIRRLYTTSIITTIRLDDQKAAGERPFSWLADYWIPKKYREGPLVDIDSEEPDPSKPWMIELPPWLYKAVIRRKDILAVHPDYFNLTGGIERWLYRLSRKSVPDKTSGEPQVWKYRMDTLHERSGSTRPRRKFAHDIRDIEKRQPLPEYGITVHSDGKHELVSMWRDPSKLRRPPRGLKLITV